MLKKCIYLYLLLYIFVFIHFLFLGNTWETMPRNVAINSLATWMIEHPFIQETNFERNTGNNVDSVSADRGVNYQ